MDYLSLAESWSGQLVVRVSIHRCLFLPSHSLGATGGVSVVKVIAEQWIGCFGFSTMTGYQLGICIHDFSDEIQIASGMSSSRTLQTTNNILYMIAKYKALLEHFRLVYVSR